MKNVIVMYSHNTSAWYLGNEVMPNDTSGFIAPNFDICEVYDNGTFDQDYRIKFQTDDGIQYWHFKEKGPVNQVDWKAGSQNKRDLRYWVTQLDDLLRTENKGEKIDGLVIPIGNLDESATLVTFVKEFKERFPDAKVIVHNPNIMFPPYNDKKNLSRLAWPSRENYKRNGVILRRDPSGKITAETEPTFVLEGENNNVTADVQDDGLTYGLADGVDAATIYHDSQGDERIQQKLLREVLGMTTPKVKVGGANPDGTVAPSRTKEIE